MYPMNIVLYMHSPSTASRLTSKPTHSTSTESGDSAPLQSKFCDKLLGAATFKYIYLSIVALVKCVPVLCRGVERGPICPTCALSRPILALRPQEPLEGQENPKPLPLQGKGVSVTGCRLPHRTYAPVAPNSTPTHPVRAPLSHLVASRNHHFHRGCPQWPHPQEHRPHGSVCMCRSHRVHHHLLCLPPQALVSPQVHAPGSRACSYPSAASPALHKSTQQPPPHVLVSSALRSNKAAGAAAAAAHTLT